jgi:Ca2+-binding RTX toxin-like protein
MFERHETEIRSAVLPAIETMEERRMLSATVVDGLLVVAGTNGDDVISFSLNASGSKVKVSVNGDSDAFRLSDVLRISASGKDGHDKIRMNNKNGVLEFKARMRGGEGNDTLVGGDMNDKLFGGIGNDLLRGGDGDDDLQGEDGDDNCQGDQGNDVLDGGQGEDELWGGDGDDQGEDEDGDSVLDEDDQGEDGGGNQQ